MLDMKQFINDHLFEHVMRHGIDSYQNYIGYDWIGWLCGPMKTRDSGVLEVSNFETILEYLGGEIEGIVEVRSCNHWACGYFDQVMVNAQCLDAVKKLMDVYRLLEQYPVFDDDDYNQRVLDYESETFEQYRSIYVDEIMKYFKLENVGDRNLKRLENLAYEIYSNDSRYYGHELAWVNTESIKRYMADESKYCSDQKLIKALEVIYAY